jgi:hypothetical protein
MDTAAVGPLSITTAATTPTPAERRSFDGPTVSSSANSKDWQTPVFSILARGHKEAQTPFAETKKPLPKII